jgi:hypothetical protein
LKLPFKGGTSALVRILNNRSNLYGEAYYTFLTSSAKVELIVAFREAKKVTIIHIFSLLTVPTHSLRALQYVKSFERPLIFCEPFKLFDQGILTDGGGSVQSTSSSRQLVFIRKVNNIFKIKRN